MKSHFRGGSAFLHSVSVCQQGIFQLYLYLKGKTKDISRVCKILVKREIE